MWIIVNDRWDSIVLVSKENFRNTISLVLTMNEWEESTILFKQIIKKRDYTSINMLVTTLLWSTNPQRAQIWLKPSKVNWQLNFLKKQFSQCTTAYFCLGRLFKSSSWANFHSKRFVERYLFGKYTNTEMSIVTSRMVYKSIRDHKSTMWSSLWWCCITFA